MLCLIFSWMRNRVYLLHSWICEESKATRLYERNYAYPYIYNCNSQNILCTEYPTTRSISSHFCHLGFIYLCLNCTDFAINLNGIKGIRFESTWKPRHWKWKQETSDFELHVTKHFTACSSHRFINKRKQIYLYPLVLSLSVYQCKDKQKYAFASFLCELYAVLLRRPSHWMHFRTSAKYRNWVTW